MILYYGFEMQSVNRLEVGL